MRTTDQILYQNYLRHKIFIEFKKNENNIMDAIQIDPLNPMLRAEGQQSVPYRVKLNSYGFRSDEFKTQHEGKHLLFAGCSETYGQGGELEDSWAHRVYSSIKEKENVSGYFNVSRCGAGAQDIISNLLFYCNRFGKPDSIFMLLPNLTRFISFLKLPGLNNSHTGFYPLGSHARGVTIIGSGTKLITEDFQRWEDDAHMDHFAHYVLYIRLLEQWCKDSNINLFWGTWDDDHRLKNVAKYATMDINSQIDFTVTEDEVFNLISKMKNLTIKKPDLHYGTAYHYIWAERFYKEYERVENAKS